MIRYHVIDDVVSFFALTTLIHFFVREKVVNYIIFLK